MFLVNFAIYLINWFAQTAALFLIQCVAYILLSSNACAKKSVIRSVYIQHFSERFRTSRWCNAFIDDSAYENSSLDEFIENRPRKILRGPSTTTTTTSRTCCANEAANSAKCPCRAYKGGGGGDTQRGAGRAAAAAAAASRALLVPVLIQLARLHTWRCSAAGAYCAALDAEIDKSSCCCCFFFFMVILFFLKIFGMNFLMKQYFVIQAWL